MANKTLQDVVDSKLASIHARGDTLVLACLKATLANFGASDPETPAELAEGAIRDLAGWLHAEVARSASWLTHTDLAGLPLRVGRMTSPDAVAVEIARAPADLDRTTVLPPQADEETFAFLGDGWSVVRLQERSALDREFAIQGLETERDLPHREGLAYYSVRDDDDTPRATLKAYDDRLVEVLYARYRTPDADEDDVVGVLRDFLHDSAKWEVTNAPKAFGRVVDTYGVWHPIRHLPVGLKLARGLSLSFMDVSRLPEDMDAGPRLDVSYTPISLLPRGLVVDRLTVAHSQVKEIPDGVVVRKSIEAEKGQIARFGSDVADEVVVEFYGSPVQTTVGELRRQPSNPRSAMRRLRSLIDS